MAHYPREEDLTPESFPHSGFFYSNPVDKGSLYPTYLYGCEYEILEVKGKFPQGSLVIKLVNLNEHAKQYQHYQDPQTVPMEYFCTYFVYLNDEEKFSIYLSHDAGTSEIVITNEPLPTETFTTRYAEKKRRYDGG